MRRQASHSPQGSPPPVTGFAALTIQRHRQDPRGRRFPDAARAGEEVAVRDAALRHGTPQGGGHVVLGDEIGELFGAVFAGKRDH